MQSYFKFRHHPKVAPTSTQGPKQIVILLGVGTNHRAICGDQRASFYVVRRKSVKAGQPAKSATQDQSGSAGVRHDAGRKGQTFFLRGSIDRSQQATACEATTP